MMTEEQRQEILINSKNDSAAVRNLFACLMCGKYKLVTWHHVIPKRFHSHSNVLIALCRDCHDKLDNVFEEVKL